MFPVMLPAGNDFVLFGRVFTTAVVVAHDTWEAHVTYTAMEAVRALVPVCYRCICVDGNRQKAWRSGEAVMPRAPKSCRRRRAVDEDSTRHRKGGRALQPWQTTPHEYGSAKTCVLQSSR